MLRGLALSSMLVVGLAGAMAQPAQAAVVPAGTSVAVPQTADPAVTQIGYYGYSGGYGYYRPYYYPRHYRPYYRSYYYPRYNYYSYNPYGYYRPYRHYRYNYYWGY